MCWERIIRERMEKIAIKRKLDVSHATQSVWLVKIPQAVYQKWEEMSPGETLGTLNIASIMSQGKAVPNLTVQLKEEDNLSPEEIVIADEYTMEETPSSSSMLALDYNEEKERFSIKGRISKRYTFKAKQNEKYQQIIRNRTSAAQQVKQAKRADNAQTLLSAFEPKNVDFIPPAYVDDRKRNSEMNSGGGKRAKGVVDPAEIRQGVISAFGKREHLTFKEIKTFCRSAPETDLRDLLKQYCVFQSKGPLKNYYSLKPEYRASGPGVTPES
jgi:hypothetical protein